MFATPLFVPLHETLASHVFGRLMPQRSLPGAAEVVIAPVQQAAVMDDEIFDLAQRVREVGEW